MNDFFMQPLFDVFRSRHSVRAYQSNQIREPELDSIIEAGRTAPSGGAYHTTHMIVVQDPEVLEKLRNLVAEEFAKMTVDEDTFYSIRDSVREAKNGGYDFFYHAPTLIIAANRIDYINAMADTTCVLSNMTLAATALGIGSCWINQLRLLRDNPNIRAYMKELGMADGETVYASLALGYPADGSELRPWHSLRKGNPVTYVR